MNMSLIGGIKNMQMKEILNRKRRVRGRGKKYLKKNVLIMGYEDNDSILDSLK